MRDVVARWTRPACCGSDALSYGVSILRIWHRRGAVNQVYTVACM